MYTRQSLVLVAFVLVRLVELVLVLVRICTVKPFIYLHSLRRIVTSLPDKYLICLTSWSKRRDSWHTAVEWVGLWWQRKRRKNRNSPRLPKTGMNSIRAESWTACERGECLGVIHVSGVGSACLLLTSMVNFILTCFVCSTKVAIEQVHGIMSQVMKDILFNFKKAQWVNHAAQPVKFEGTD